MIFGHDGAMDHDATAAPRLIDFAPATFLQRGVTIPFTAPELAGTTARPGERVALELVVPNPGGGPGVYILPWDAVWSICRPTAHDCQLVAAVGAVRAITPATIRAAARAVAAEGLAGREAAAAAVLATAEEQRARILLNFTLLLELLRQIEPRRPGWIPPEQDRPAHIEERARDILAGLADRFGCRQETLASALEELAGLLCGVGIGAGADNASLPVLLAAIKRLRADIATWSASHLEQDSQEIALIDACAGLTVTAASTVIEAARAPIVDLPALLRAWLHSPAAVTAILTRPDWLLDGWERICLLWRDTAPADRGIAIIEIVPMLPLVPAEANGWVAVDVARATELLRHRRSVRGLEDWRTGVMLTDIIARNERLLAAPGLAPLSGPMLTPILTPTLVP